MQAFQRRFIELAVAREALRFGRFELKSGRISPYFFNAGSFCDGGSAATLGQCYAAAIAAAEFDFDFLFGQDCAQVLSIRNQGALMLKDA